jgi:hypothetical protein
MIYSANIEFHCILGRDEDTRCCNSVSSANSNGASRVISESVMVTLRSSCKLNMLEKDVISACVPVYEDETASKISSLDSSSEVSS